MAPRMQDIFLERANTDNDAFRRWFRNSKVVDESGNPAVVYHGTVASENFDVFRQFNDLGHHFGTAQAANDRLAFWDKDERYKGKVPQRIYPVYLSIQNPLWLDDGGTWEPDGIAYTLMKNGEGEHRRRNQGEISKDEYTRVAMKGNRKAKTEELVKILKNRGYDGVRYRNTSEDTASVSWIAFDSWQIKSVYNRGTWDRKRGSIME